MSTPPAIGPGFSGSVLISDQPAITTSSDVLIKGPSRKESTATTSLAASEVSTRSANPVPDERGVPRFHGVICASNRYRFLQHEAATGKSVGVECQLLRDEKSISVNKITPTLRCKLGIGSRGSFTIYSSFGNGTLDMFRQDPDPLVNETRFQEKFPPVHRVYYNAPVDGIGNRLSEADEAALTYHIYSATQLASALQIFTKNSGDLISNASSSRSKDQGHCCARCSELESFQDVTGISLRDYLEQCLTEAIKSEVAHSLSDLDQPLKKGKRDYEAEKADVNG